MFERQLREPSEIFDYNDYNLITIWLQFDYNDEPSEIFDHNEEDSNTIYRAV